MTEQTSTWIVRAQRDTTNTTAEDALHAVVPRETLVDEREVSVEQIDDRSILTHDRAEEHLGFLLERSAEVLVEVRRIGSDVLQLAQEQPLAGEVADQSVRAGVGEQPADLTLEHRRVLELTAHRRF